MPADAADPRPSMIEPLEQRRFLDATLFEGTLSVIGTHLDDHIDLTIGTNSRDKITVTINGVAAQFTVANVQRIRIQAGQGDDFVYIDPNKKDLDQPTSIYGSGGDDTIQSGYGKDRIYGGFGVDSIKGGRARDIMYGEHGNDTLDGELGHDRIDGGRGADLLIGGPGVDRLVGGKGADRFLAADGLVDSINGGPEQDTVLDHDPDLDNLIDVEIT